MLRRNDMPEQVRKIQVKADLNRLDWIIDRVVQAMDGELTEEEVETIFYDLQDLHIDLSTHTLEGYYERDAGEVFGEMEHGLGPIRRGEKGWDEKYRDLQKIKNYIELWA